jgi:TRAP-type C4-dicarboxylate transport system substrate-binding protein
MKLDTKVNWLVSRLARRVTMSLIVALGLMTAPQPGLAAETVKMTIVAGHPPVLLWVKHFRDTLIPTANSELAKSGKYKIQWTQAYAGTLAKVGEELETIQQGLADIGGAWNLFDPAKLPLQNVGYMSPFNEASPETVTEIVEGLQKKIPAFGAQWTKYNQVYLGGGIAADSYHLWSNYPIKKLADLKGHKFGAPGPAVNWFKGTGGVGVSANLTLYFNDIKTGVYDGVMVFATAAMPQKLDTVAPYITISNIGTGYAGGVTANQDRWKKLPGEVKAAIMTGVGAYKTAFYKELDKRIKASFAIMKKRGAKIAQLPAGDRVKWAKTVPNVAKGWAAGLTKKGLPGRQVLEGYMNELRARGAKPVRDWDKE